MANVSPVRLQIQILVLTWLRKTSSSTAAMVVPASVSTPDMRAVRRAALGLPPPSALLTLVLEAPEYSTQAPCQILREWNLVIRPCGGPPSVCRRPAHRSPSCWMHLSTALRPQFWEEPAEPIAHTRAVKAPVKSTQASIPSNGPSCMSLMLSDVWCKGM